MKVRPYFLGELFKKMLEIDISYVIVHTYMEFLKSGLLYKTQAIIQKKLFLIFQIKKISLSGSLLLEVPNQSGGGMGISRSTRLESFVRNDTVLWKSARSAVHHFLITSLLIGNDANRKAFASIYR